MSETQRQQKNNHVNDRTRELDKYIQSMVRLDPARSTIDSIPNRDRLRMTKLCACALR